jgi:hypothetical protein
LVTCYSPGRHFTQGLLPFLVRLACVRHAASVDSEPGSNSRLKPDCLPTDGRQTAIAAARTDGMAAVWINTKQLSCEIRSDSNPSHSSHDWHVQPSLSKTESRSRLSGRPSVEDGSDRKARCEMHTATPDPLVLETVTPYRSRNRGVNPLCSQDFHHFSTDLQALDSILRRKNTRVRIYLPLKRSFLSAQQSLIFRLPEHCDI